LPPSHCLGVSGWLAAVKELYGHWKHLSSLAAGDRRMQQTDNFEADGTQIDSLSAQGSN